ncbi:MAG: phospholipase [Muribaculaceae bacterium]|nr:phospholipase [Muribaculaceae bacterium]
MIHVGFIIGGAIVGVGAILYLHHRLTESPSVPVIMSEEKADEAEKNDSDSDEECCGMHITCQRDSLSPVFGEDIVYFDDEELDEYRGRSSEDYDAEEIEQFRDVLLTLLPDDIAPWARSIQQRGINLPSEVREELFMIVNEARNHVISQSNVS